MRFVFPDVPCDSNSNLDLSENAPMQPEKGVSISAAAPRKRKLSSISVEMDPILEEEDNNGAEQPISSIESSCVVDDVKSSAPNTSSINSDNSNNAILDAAAVSHSHGQLPVVRVELTTPYCPDCSNTTTTSTVGGGSPVHHLKTETLLNNSVVATAGTTEAESQTTMSPPKPYMVAEQHASRPPGYCRDDSSARNTLYYYGQSTSPAVAQQQPGSIHSCKPQGYGDDSSARDAPCEQPTSPVIEQQKDNPHADSSPLMNADDNHLKSTSHGEILPLDPVTVQQLQHDDIISSYAYVEGYEGEEDKSNEQLSSPILAKHCSLQKNRGDSNENNSCEQLSSPMVAKQLGRTRDSLQCKTATYYKRPSPLVAKQLGKTQHARGENKDASKQHNSSTHGYRSPQAHRKERSSIVDNNITFVRDQPHPPPPSGAVTTSYDCSTTSGASSQQAVGIPHSCIEGRDSSSACGNTSSTVVGFSHSNTHIGLSNNKTGVHSRSLGNGAARTRCELLLRSKATTVTHVHKAGGIGTGTCTTMHSVTKEVIAAGREQLTPLEVASRPKEGRSVVAASARVVGPAQTGYCNNGKEGNSAPPPPHHVLVGKRLDDDLSHTYYGPYNQASSLIEPKSKLDHLPLPLRFDQQSQGTFQASLHKSVIARNHDYLKSENVAALHIQQSDPPKASSIPPAVSVLKCTYQPSVSTEEETAGSNLRIITDSEKTSTHKQQSKPQEGQDQGPETSLTKRPNSVVGIEKPYSTTKQIKLRDVAALSSAMHECQSAGHTLRNEGLMSKGQLQEGALSTPKCKIPRRMCTPVQIGSVAATTRSSFGDRKGSSPTTTGGHAEKNTLPISSVNQGGSSSSPLTKQEVKSQLTTSNGISGVGSASLLPKRAPKVYVGRFHGLNERGTDGNGEELGENGGNQPTSEAASKTLVPASTIARFNVALKTKGDSHDQTSTNEDPALIRLASATDDGIHAALSMSCGHEPMPAPTINQKHDCNSQKIGGLLAGSSKNEQQTKNCDNISADCETVHHNQNNASGIQHHGNTGSSGTACNRSELGVAPSNYHHTKGRMLQPPKVRPKSVAVLHKTTSKPSPQNTSQPHLREAKLKSGGKVGGSSEKIVPEITRKRDCKSNFKVDGHPLVTTVGGTEVLECGKLTRNEDQIVLNPSRGTNYSNLQENQRREVETVSTNLPHPVSHNVPKTTSSNPSRAVGYPASLGNSDGSVPMQHKFSGMHTHTFSHPPDALPNATPQESEQNNLEKAFNVDNSPPTKTGEINRNSVIGPFHELNCPAEQPSVGRVAIDYGNMTTCSGGPLPVAANSKLKSLKSSHPNKQHANTDRPSPIRYTQTDI